MNPKTVLLTIAPVLWLALACVSETAGYNDVQKLTTARLDTEARWHTVDGAPTREVQALLSRPLTAEAAGKIAVLNSPRLQAEFEKLGIARSAWVRAVQLPNPTVGVAL